MQRDGGQNCESLDMKPKGLREAVGGHFDGYQMSMLTIKHMQENAVHWKLSDKKSPLKECFIHTKVNDQHISSINKVKPYMHVSAFVGVYTSRHPFHSMF